jgi:hypothetical protein
MPPADDVPEPEVTEAPATEAGPAPGHGAE